MAMGSLSWPVMIVMEVFLRYSGGSLEGVRIRRVRIGEVGWVSASFMKARPLAPGLCFLVGWFRLTYMCSLIGCWCCIWLW